MGSGISNLESTPTPGALARVACLLEVTARKPGNVHRSRDFDDGDFLDFLLSASAIGEPLDRARSEGVGAAILAAVEATRRVVSANTNLGMILLLAPLAAVPEGIDLRRGAAGVLAALTVADARLAYRAIRLARPGGLGSSPEQDVAGEPTVTLLEAMRLAAHRDLIARQYADGFAEVLGLALPALAGALRDGRGLEAAIVRTQLTVMARHPDTLIARKLGTEAAAESARRADEALRRGATPEALRELDAWLRADGHARNPGASADLVAAALFAALRDGTIELPRRVGWAAGRVAGFETGNLKF